MPSIEWLPEQKIAVPPPKRPKKITGTRFAAILGRNRWCTPFQAWCAITRTYEKPFEDTPYTLAGKAIEPKQADYMRRAYFMTDLAGPADLYGPDYFRTTRGDFFPDSPIFGGMWDYLRRDGSGKPAAVLEMKTTKRSEDWLRGVPEYYALQAALYAALLGVEQVIMVCSFLEPEDYQRPEAYRCRAENTIVRPFRLSERYANMAGILNQAERWWEAHVLTGVSPPYDERADAEVLKALRTRSGPPDDAGLAAQIREAEALKARLDAAKTAAARDERRYKELVEALRAAALSRFRDGDTAVALQGEAYDWTAARYVQTSYDLDAMRADGLDLDKYRREEISCRFGPKPRKSATNEGGTHHA